MSQSSAQPAGPTGGVLIVDFGAQYCQLIARRVREMDVYSYITAPERALFMIQHMRPQAVILSGGPRSVYEHDAPALDPAILQQGVPVLGICYGLQWLAQHTGGEVTPAQSGAEYGRTELQVMDSKDLLAGTKQNGIVWMSHGDKVARLGPGFAVLAQSQPCPFAVVADRARKFYGLQFHPEVAHTEDGTTMLQNFVLRIAKCSTDWKPGNLVETKIAAVKKLVGERGEVVMGLSGGVDSSVAAVLIHRAIGKRLHCVFVDNGLLRAGEREGVEELFRDHYRMDLKVVDASERFLGELKGVTDPEQKRKIIGRVFVEVFRGERERCGNARFLGQGTLYPDVIESVAAHGGATSTIKSHHNVGGLPKDLDMTLVEPLRDLFKDEVRELGRELGLPSSLVDRQPFPGPGLAVRCLGEVTRQKLEPLRGADRIVREEVEKNGLHKGLWQYFAVYVPQKSVGVKGDARVYEDIVMLRLVSSQDAMTADWELLPTPVLKRISSRILNEVKGFSRVCLDISSKPPATIEWE
ncbi:MAG: glutamine-hydrolyzing GMP synthase [Planctomycetes bacterium]|jgi:GMP synthase (glutamine-hydrolysing)|nr:glutamine-hydrolyzing GMP synthase [Planctomycetota bacterium]